MRAERERTKKLVAAFHFQQSDPSRWKCGDCRGKGLDGIRRCGYLPPERRAPERIVWSRNGAATTECPKSYISQNSTYYLERYVAWTLSRQDMTELDAKVAEAIVVLDHERRKATNDDQSTRT